MSQYIPLDANISNNKIENFNISPPIKESFMDTEMKMNQLTFSKKKDGSLLEMFESPAFETQMIFKYLQTTTRPCIVQYLMNKLYRENRNDIKLIDFYFP